MTDEAQRIAIAEFCGWSQFMMGTGVPPEHKENRCDYARPIPKYLSDLNAIHEAESKLSLIERDVYWIHLARITENGRMATGRLFSLDTAWLTTTATARQRCEALLRTIGKWVES